MRREREEEMIHRGVQYSRAIRRYVKKTGRYPSRLEELENTNNIRFLRKRYKDPITGKDFKLLHVGEVQMTGAAGIAGAASVGGGMVPGASPLGGATRRGGPAAAAAASMLLGAAANQRASATGATPATGWRGGQLPVRMLLARPMPDVDQSSGQSTNLQSRIGQAIERQCDKLSSTVFGGGPIVGVASISKAQTIREFNHKNHYNQWQFIYDPTMDRGGLDYNSGAASVAGKRSHSAAEFVGTKFFDAGGFRLWNLEFRGIGFFQRAPESAAGPARPATAIRTFFGRCLERSRTSLVICLGGC